MKSNRFYARIFRLKRFAPVVIGAVGLVMLIAATAVGSGQIQRVSTKSDGAQVTGENYSQYNSVSEDGHFVAYQGSACALPTSSCGSGIHVFRKNTITGEIKMVVGNGFMPSISADGRFVAYYSGSNVYETNVDTGATTTVSTDSSGNPGSGGTAGTSYSPAVSADGRYVAFSSPFTNLVTGDTNGVWDVFVKDTLTGTTTRVSKSAAGAQGTSDSGKSDYVGRNLDISRDGRYVAFQSRASNLVAGGEPFLNIYRKDLQTDAVIKVSTRPSGVWGFENPSISADGSYIAYESSPYSGSHQIYLTDLTDVSNVSTSLVSTDGSGTAANGNSIEPAVSIGGRVTFASYATNIVSGDINGQYDVFVKDVPAGGSTFLVSLSAAGQHGNSMSTLSDISDNGAWVSFASQSSNLVSGDTNGTNDVFLKAPDFPDYTAPVITTPGTLIFEATGPSGAAVTYQYGATDPDDAVASMGCSPPSGSTFPIGTTTVNCSATDTHGNTSSASFNVTVRDTTAPVLTLPPDISLEGNSGGAPYTYTASAADTVYGAVPATCTPPSGSTFPLGTTTVSCSATDGYGNTASGSFHVTVYATPPVLSVPANMTLEATGPSGAAVTYQYGATDPDDAVASLACSPPSGSTFPVGTTTVNCSATDTHGNTGTASFDVTVTYCQPGARPALFLSHESFWASYADYLYHQMSVNFAISNHGPDTAHSTAITGSVNSNGAVLLTSTPIWVGDIDDGSAKSAAVKYYVPVGVIQFDAELTGEAQDACGTVFIYPPE